MFPGYKHSLIENRAECIREAYMIADMPFNNALFMLLKTLLSNEESDQLRTSSFGKIIDFFLNSGKCVVRPSL